MKKESTEKKWVTPTQKEKGEKKAEMSEKERVEYLSTVKREAQEKVKADLEKYTDELKAKVEAARLQEEKDIEEKISKRELLITEAKKNDELLGTARETLEYFVSMQELGQLDSVDAKNLKELHTLVSSLENQRVEIEKKIAVISSHPEVPKKLDDIAKKEDAERVVKNLVEQSHVELDPQIDQLATAIKNLASRDNSLWQLIKRQEPLVSSAWKKIEDISGRAEDMLSKKSNFDSTLRQILRESTSTEELSQKLTEARKSFGMFKGKEKAAIDFILSQTQAFDEYSQTAEQLSSLRQQQESIKGERYSLSEQFKEILRKSWETQDKISELTGSSSSWGLPTDLWHRLSRHIERFADLQRWEGNRKVGKHEGWFNATRNPEGKSLYDTWMNVTETAGGYGLTIRNPNRAEREEKTEEKFKAE